MKMLTDKFYSRLDCGTGADNVVDDQHLRAAGEYAVMQLDPMRTERAGVRRDANGGTGKLPAKHKQGTCRGTRWQVR